MRFRHFFWDFDGTLYDTYGRITRACVKALESLGAAAAFDQVYPVAKRSLNACYEVFAAPLGIKNEAYLAAYHVFSHQEGPESIRPYPGAKEALEAVVRLGGENYLYTHRGRTAAEWLSYDGLDGLFADVTSLYRLDQTSMRQGAAEGGTGDMGPLPTASKALLITLAVTWILIAIYYIRGRIKASHES